MLHGTLDVGGRSAAWWFTDRRGGVSAPPYDTRNIAAHVGDDPEAVRRNRADLGDAIGLSPISWMGPVHGVDAAWLDEPCAITPNVDVLVTDRAKLPLATMGADCVPLLLAAGHMVIAAHVGWRGLVDGMTAGLVGLLARHGVPADGAQVLLGPAICGACYGIPAARAASIAAACPEALTGARSGSIGADIRAGLRAQWTAEHATVQIVGGCTAEQGEYFSHRRDGVTGRQAGVIAWMR